MTLTTTRMKTIATLILMLSLIAITKATFASDLIEEANEVIKAAATATALTTTTTVDTHSDYPKEMQTPHQSRRSHRNLQVVLQELGSATFDIPVGTTENDFKYFLSNDTFTGRIYEVTGTLAKPLKGTALYGTTARCRRGSINCQPGGGGDTKLRILNTETTATVTNLTIDVTFAAQVRRNRQLLRDQRIRNVQVVTTVADVGFELNATNIEESNTLIVTVFGEKFDSQDGDDDDDNDEDED